MVLTTTSTDTAGACPICKSPTTSLLSQSLRHGKGNVYYCHSCDHGFLDQAPSNLKEYYAEEYRKTYSHKAIPSTTESEEIFTTYVKYQDSRLKIILPLLKTDTTFLEVGASAGQFIYHIKDKVASIHAIELDERSASYIKNTLSVETDTNFLEASKFANNQYSMIASFQVIEHTPDPINFLKTLLKTLEPGGQLFIEMPNLYDPLLSVWASQAYSDFYYHSAHLQYFSTRSLSCLTKACGIKPEKLCYHYIQDYNLLNHLNWLTNKKPQVDCHSGLSPIELAISNSPISSWLSETLASLNDTYINRLAQEHATSNILLQINL
ncbi:bifunctional 2-polyprenyl-6-hydroxyphenol methylase/3-demethylubiquinol 3-O-methyltransferase UbiG [Synechococcus sp. UW179B]|uniref:class I SAM-dependent methyltransferase n=1 Tax=Synechococcus sp. UW179B TaxID=2575516 RepID=UPI000E0F2AD6|nr:class I SAM-dependent methyltransferase [Synechococcus sp. UW179B]